MALCDTEKKKWGTMKKQKSVLIIDDNGFIVSLIKNALRHTGLKVMGATSIMTGRSLIYKLRPDIVILDRYMPEEDGHDLLREVRDDSRLRNIPILMLSAENTQTEILDSIRLGANDYMVKPFKNGVLNKKINRLLNAPYNPDPDSVFMVG